MPNIRKNPLKENEWMIDESIKMPDGSFSHFGKTGYKTKKEALDDCARQEALFIQRRGFEQSKDSFSNLCKMFLAHTKTLRKPTTYHDMERDIRDRIENKLLGKSTAEVFSGSCLSNWREDFLKDTAALSQKRVNWILSFMEKIGHFGFEIGCVSEQGLRLSMLASERVPERVSPKKSYTIWSYEDYRKFIGTFDEGDRYIVLFQWLFFSGCRIGEALAIQWKDLDLDRQIANISKSCSPGVGTGKTEFFTTKTEAGRRSIYISDAMTAQFKKLKEAYLGKPDDYCFFGKRVIGRMTVRRVFTEHTNAAKLPYIKIHEIRHTVNTWLLSKDRSTDELKAITARLGRSSLKVTMDIYFHSKRDTDKKLAEEIKI